MQVSSGSNSRWSLKSKFWLSKHDEGTIGPSCVVDVRSTPSHEKDEFPCITPDDGSPSWENASHELFPISESLKKLWHSQIVPPSISNKHPKHLFKDFHLSLDLAAAKIYRAIRKSDGATVAIKKIMNREDPLIQSFINNEVFVSFLCNGGPNILRYHSTYQTKSNTWLVMDWVDGCTLKEALTVVPVPTNVIAYIVSKVLETLCWMHSRHRIHRDIKSTNILVNTFGKLFVMDFGYAVQYSSELNTSTESAGTLLFMAPEVAIGEPYNYPCDIWSLGILVYEMVHGHPPRADLTIERQIQELVEEPAPRLSAEYDGKWISDFVAKCLHKDPARRLSANDLQYHPFLREACSETEWTRFLTGLPQTICHFRMSSA